MPPTSTTSAMSLASTPASLIALRQGSSVRLISSSTSRSRSARLIDLTRCFGPRRVGGDEGQVDLGGLCRAELDLRLFGRFLQALQRKPVAAKVDAFRLLERVGQIFDDLGVEILAAEEGVAIGGLHLEHAVADLQDRDVERAAAKVVDRDRLAVLLLQPVGERSRGRLVDDAQHFKTGNLAGILGRLALRVVEVSGTVITAWVTVSPR
jgi:hypothetical protein